MSIDKDLKQLVPWYKEPWGIFVFAPLFIVVITCSIMVTIAFKYSDDVVKGEYVKTGKLYDESFSAENQAKRLNISADITIDLDTFMLSLTIHATNVIEDATLSLAFLHPIDEHLDQFYTLERVSLGRYEIALPEKPKGRWYFQLQNANDVTDAAAKVVLSETQLSEGEGSLSDNALSADEHWRIKQAVNFDGINIFSVSSQLDTPK